MKFTCDRAVLAQGVATASRAVLGRSSLPVLEGLLLTLSPDCLQLTGYDMETGIRCSIPANTRDSGELVLPCSTFSDILKKLPEGEVVVEAKGDDVTITAGFSVFNIIGIAGAMKAKGLTDEQKKSSTKEFNFGKGIVIALLCGFMSGCFNVGLAFGQDIFAPGTDPMFQTLPATFLVTMGGFVTNAIYCLVQNSKNRTWSDYGKADVWANNLFFCLLAGALWYSQFFGLSMGKGFLTGYPTLMTLSFCILMALNVVFSNVWGIILKEWKGCKPKTIAVLVAGIVVLVISCFLPQLI